MRILALQHMETKFIKVGLCCCCCCCSANTCYSYHSTSAECVQIDAEKSPFLVEKLKIWMLPTLACVKQVHTDAV